MFRFLLKIVLVCITAFLGGFLWFVSSMPSEPARYDTPTDAIVVLTGSAGRIKEGTDLFTQGKAKYLYISGVYPSVTKEMLFRHANINPAILACCVLLEYTAVDTVGNARETAKWVVKQGFKSIRLVTADYHMRRSLLQFHAVLPHVTIVAHPLETADVVLAKRWEDSHTIYILLKEYVKWLVAVGQKIIVYST